ncbi:hypothetical protein FA13DRAFT_1729688 [Coprinellus micaceus]|uniref:F-box domain-containing protein n=1 Tax=Coprinellus micaceus TaxID=71717 RepID=A0A4Y7TJR7_COPMI|nr:hypothetical protein FA13DRAFT_1729688 [Coprinellus micaceus]
MLKLLRFFLSPTALRRRTRFMSSSAPCSQVHDHKVHDINKLAAEILGRVFELRQQGVLDDGSSLLQLTSFAKGCPQLWTRVECDLPSTEDRWEARLPGIVSALERWFGRAGGLPLTLHVAFRVMFVQQGFLELLQFIARNPKWGTLLFTDLREKWSWVNQLLLPGSSVSQEIDNAACWPLLRTLEIHAPEVELYFHDFPLLPLASHAPNLQDFTIEYAAIEASNGSAGDEQGCASFLLFILKDTQNLRRLEVSESQIGPPIVPTHGLSAMGNTDGVTYPLSLPHLESISLDLNETILKPFFENIRFPALHSIELQCRTRSHPREYSRFLNWGLEEACKEPELWPQLEHFELYLGVNKVEVREGDPGFAILKQAPYTWYILAGTPFGSP